MTSRKDGASMGCLLPACSLRIPVFLTACTGLRLCHIKLSHGVYARAARTHIFRHGLSKMSFPEELVLFSGGDLL